MTQAAAKTALKTETKTPEKSELIGLDEVHEIVHVSLLTGFIKDSIPISLMLVAPSGGGKTQSLERFTAPFIHKTNDLTSAGLWDILREDTKEQVSHIMLPDFNPVLSHKSSVSGLTIASLLSVMCDGVMRFDDGRQKKELKHRPIAIITGVTPDMFERHLNKWRELGFVRRFLPIHFNYTLNTIQAAQKSVRAGNHNGKVKQHVEIIMPKTQVSPIISSESAAEIENLSVYLGNMLGIISIPVREQSNWKWKMVLEKPVLPMSPHIILRTMAQARALKNGRGKVDETDIKFIRRVVDFSNALNPAQL